MLPDDSVNMKFVIGKLEPHCFAISFTLLALLKLVFVLGLYLYLLWLYIDHS